jgi:hypothetical protein
VNRETDGWSDGQTDREKELNGGTDGQTDREMDEKID